ncbi:Beta-adducin [Dirofilaria immitis]
MLVASTCAQLKCSDLLDHLQSSVMTKQSNDTTAQNDVILPSSSKVNKLKSSKISHGSMRLSHLLSKISRKDKKTSDNYYTSAEPPFTSTPDMSGEEDGIEVSYVETESEHNGDSEDTIPAADSVNVKSTPSRMIYVDSIALDDSTTTTTTGSAEDYSSNSVSEKTSTEEQMIRANFTDCKSPNEQVVQTTTSIVSTSNTNANVVENTSCKNRVNFNRMWYIAAVSIQLFLAIFVLFWSLVILKIFYNDFYITRSKPSMLCSGIEAIDEWLLLDLAQTIKCNDDSNSFFERLIHEAEVFAGFLIAQFRFIPIIWSSLTSMTFIQLYEWLLEIMRNIKEVLNEYYEIVWTNYLKRYFDMIWEKYYDIIWEEYYDMIWINMDDWKEKWCQTTKDESNVMGNTRFDFTAILWSSSSNQALSFKIENLYSMIKLAIFCTSSAICPSFFSLPFLWVRCSLSFFKSSTNGNAFMCVYKSTQLLFRFLEKYPSMIRQITFRLFGHCYFPLII